MATRPSFDLGLIRSLAGLVHDMGLSEISVRKGDLDIRILGPAPGSRDPGRDRTKEAIEARPVGAVTPSHLPMTSPMVGTARLSRGREGVAPVGVGSVVREGDVILVIEALKSFNEIRATGPGTVAAILVAEGQPVEFAQPLVRFA